VLIPRISCIRATASLSGLEVTVASALCEGRKPLTAASTRTDSGSFVPCDSPSPSLPAVGVWQNRDREESLPLLSAVEVSEIIDVVRPILLPLSFHAVQFRGLLSPRLPPHRRSVTMWVITHLFLFTLNILLFSSLSYPPLYSSYR
jgi:hypothetical protein